MIETPTQTLTHRRWIGRLIRVGLVVVAVVLVANWVSNRTSRAVKSAVNNSNVRFQSDAPAAAALGPGDAQIVSTDGAVELVLHGDKVLAGLSPKTVGEIRGKLDESMAKDTSGLGGSIAQMVKKTVADNIDTHVVYPLADIHDLEYEDGQIVMYNRKGEKSRLFGNAKVNDKPQSFDRAEAERFIAAVKARKQATP